MRTCTFPTTTAERSRSIAVPRSATAAAITSFASCGAPPSMARSSTTSNPPSLTPLLRPFSTTNSYVPGSGATFGRGPRRAGGRSSSLTSRSHACRDGDVGSFEEAGVRPGEELVGVRERERLELLRRHHALADEPVRLGQHTQEVRHVEVTDVAGEHHLQGCAERIRRRERERRGAIVGL